MLQTYGFTGAGRQIDAAGTSFRYESGTDSGGVTELTLRVDGVPVGTFEPGDQLDIPTACKRWELVPTSSTCNGRVRIGMGRVTSAKLNGTVSVINGERERVKAGQCFIAKFYTGEGIGVSASQFSAGMLRNPSGSGKNLMISQVSSFAVAKGLDRTDSAAYLLFAMGPDTLFGSSALSSTQPKNKKSGGGASVASCYRCPDGSPKATKPDSAYLVAEGTALAQTAFPLDLTEPILLPPGHALMVYAFGTYADCIFQFTEEAV